MFTRALRLPAPGTETFFLWGPRQTGKTTLLKATYPDALWIVNQTPDYTATLFACHPAGSTRQRIVVHLALAPNG